MHLFSVRLFSKPAFYLALIAALVLGASGLAYRAYAAGTPATYFTACINGQGAISKVAIGLAPDRPCGDAQTQITWSDGDITEVLAGFGLAGGATSSGATLSVDPGVIQQRVAGACAVSSISAINQDGTVVCESDDNTAYTAGPGLNLNGSELSVGFAGSGSASTAARSDHTHELADGSVTTEKLANGAVTPEKLATAGSPTAGQALTYNGTTLDWQDTGDVAQFSYVSNVGDANTSSTTPVDVPGQSISLTTTGGTVFVYSTASFYFGTPGQASYFRIVRDGSVVLAFNNHDSGQTDPAHWETISMFGVDTPPAGDHTYTLQWNVNPGSNGSISISQGVYTANLSAIEFDQ